MKTPISLRLVQAAAWMAGATGAGLAAEVACPSDQFPSPTGVYRNESSANVIYGTTVQLAATQLGEPDQSAKPPTATSTHTYTVCMTGHFFVVGGAGSPPVPVTAPVNAEFTLTPNSTGLPGLYDIEVLSFSATGLPGGIMIRESPTLSSGGHHSIRKVASGNWYAESNFDVFTEISADGGGTWIPGDTPMHFDLTEPPLVAAGGNQLPAPRVRLGTADQISFSNPVRIRGLQLKASPASATRLPLAGTLYQTSETGRATGQVSQDGGTTFTDFECDYSAAIKFQATSRATEKKLASAYVLAGEIVKLDLGGGTLPPGMRVRESPTKASTGRCSSRLATDGLYRIGSFFDIFTEVSLDNGATWTPNDGPACYIVNSHGTPGVDVAAFGFTPQEVISTCVMPTPHLLPSAGHFENGDIPDQEDLIEYPDGTIIRGLDLRLPSSLIAPPAAGTIQTHSFDITVQCGVSQDGGVSYESVRGTASASLRVNAVAVGAGASTQLYEIEWLALDFSATLGSGGTLLLRESPTRQSTGKTSVRLAADGAYRIGSFFDIFTELSLDGGATWKTGPLKWMAPEAIGNERIHPTADYPPAGAPMLAEGDISCANGVVLRGVKVHSIHNGSPLPPPLGSATYPFTTTASGEISTDGGATFTGWSGDCSGVIGLPNFLDFDSDNDGSPECRLFNGELLSLDLSGGGLGSVRLRESPTKASLGRTSVRTTPNNSFGTLSFFDVFTEISLDGGATWEAAIGLPVTFAFSDTPGEHFYPTASLPPVASLESPPDQVVDLGSGRRLRKTRTYLNMNDPASRFAPPAEGESVHLQLNGTMDCEYSTDNGATYTPVRTPVACDVTATAKKRREAELNLNAINQAADAEFATLTLECTSLTFDLPGGSPVSIRESPTEPSRGEMRVRESPTLPSRDHTRLRESPTRSSLREVAGGYMIESFFDVFLEVGESSAAGLVWSPRSNLMRFVFQPVADQDNAFATTAFPPRDGVLEVGANEAPVFFGGGVMIRSVSLGDFASSVRNPGPPTRTITCSLRCETSADGGTTWSPASASGEITLQSSSVGTTGPTLHEVSALNFVLPGGVMVRESPSKASLGRTSVRTKGPESTGNPHVIDSFFDIFTEISMDGGANWIPAESACRLTACRVPLEVPSNTDWQPTPNQRIAGDPDFDLLFENTDVSISGFTLDALDITPRNAPPPAAGARLKRQCMFNLGLKARMAPGTPAEPQRMQIEVGWECGEVSSSSDRRVLINEITSMNVCGGTLPAGMMLRESPTRASHGRTSIRTVPGGYQISSFFDIFTELSLDGGQTWHEACAPLCLELADASPEHVFPATRDPLPPTTYVASMREKLPRFFESGDKPTQAQFHALLDSSLNIVDDREFIGLRHYDATIQYQVGDTSTVRRDRGTLTFGYIIWKHPDSDDSRMAYDMEVTAFEMQGGTMPSGMQMRASHVKKSKSNISSNRQADGNYRTSSFFDVFLEISHDNGGTWEACDLPLHFIQEDRVLAGLSHSDPFVPAGTRYVQRGGPVRCADGSCASSVCEFTAPSASLPAVPGVPQSYANLPAQFSATFTRDGGADIPVSADVLADVSVTLVETVGGTRYFDSEMLKLDLSAPGGVRLRESPTKASLGRHVVTDAGGGDFRVSSFFDIWTEISFDSGASWSPCDVPLRLEAAAPEMDVRLEPSAELADGASTVDFGPVLSGGMVTRNLLVSNHGNVVLSDFGCSLTGSTAGEFLVNPPAFTTIAPGATVTIPVVFNASTAAGTRTATLHIASSDSDESPFDLALTARVLAPGGDDDGDGLTNGQEMAIQGNPLYNESGGGAFNPLHSDADRLAFLRDNGLFLETDMRGLALGRPVLRRDPATGNFVLRMGLQQSPDLSPPWSPVPNITPTYDPGTGQIDLEFAPPAGAPTQFYQVFGTEP